MTKEQIKAICPEKYTYYGRGPLKYPSEITREKLDIIAYYPSGDSWDMSSGYNGDSENILYAVRQDTPLHDALFQPRSEQAPDWSLPLQTRDGVPIEYIGKSAHLEPFAHIVVYLSSPLSSYVLQANNNGEIAGFSNELFNVINTPKNAWQSNKSMSDFSDEITPQVAAE